MWTVYFANNFVSTASSWREQLMNSFNYINTPDLGKEYRTAYSIWNSVWQEIWMCPQGLNRRKTFYNAVNQNSQIMTTLITPL